MVAAEKQLLEGAGISVHQVIFDNADLQESRSFTGDLRLAASAVWSRRAARRVRAAVARHRPDVMHVHNTFAAASPSVYSAAKEVPLVQTLHNYRLVCPVATLFRDGRVCTDCVGRLIAWPGVLHACVRGSRSQSAVAAATTAVHRARGTFDREIDQYAALTTFQRQLLIDGGFPGDRIRVVPNFLEPDPGTGTGQRSGLLFVGRLAEEKGIGMLLRAAALEPGFVRVVGAGPLASRVEQAAAAGHVEYLGPLDHSQVLDELQRATALVLPSIWFEGFPMVVLEAYATATPVIATRIGSLAEVVQDGATGMLTEPHEVESLARGIRWAVGHPAQMARLGANARRQYEASYRGPLHLATLLDLYRGAAQRMGQMAVA